jgi:hypothetical protein
MHLYKEQLDSMLATDSRVATDLELLWWPAFLGESLPCPGLCAPSKEGLLSPHTLLEAQEGTGTVHLAT